MNPRDPGTLALVAAGGALAYLALRSRRRSEAYDFRDRRVVITGGSRGLGLLLARQLTAEGARVALLARDRDGLARAAEELRESGGEVMDVACDVRSQTEVQEAVTRVADRWGGVDALFNVAGVIQVGPLEHMDLMDFEQSLGVHLWGALYAVLAVVPHMRRQGSGRIVNVASIGGKIAVPHLLPYSVGKFALVGLSEGLRHELLPFGIRVTTVCPGLMRTGSHVQALFKGQHEREFAWFSLLSAVPAVSMDASRAARQIVEACRRGDPELIVTRQARLAVMAEGLFPTLVSEALSLAARVLPGPDVPEGEEMRTGWHSRPGWLLSALTVLADRATRRNNEVPREA
jgi:NAD(P)-dependent dehydrogenase (short-subunit alcohol dehydrogenase family)